MTKTSLSSIDMDILTTYNLMHRVVQPRPIGWVGTRSADGIDNLAPFSYFMPIGSAPPTVAFSSAKDRDGKEKHTLINAVASGVFTLNMVTSDLLVQMNATSASFDAVVSEFAEVGLTPITGTWVNAPFIGEAHVTAECRVIQTVPLGNTTLVIGEVLGFHVSDAWQKQDNVPPIVGRLASNEYLTTAGEKIKMDRPR